MLPTSRTLLAILRTGLGISAFGWGISFYFLFSPWSTAERQLNEMGAYPIEYQPLLDYWLRMAASAFGCIGVVSALACAWPKKWTSVICFLAPFHFFVGCSLAAAAWQNQLRWPNHPTFIPDIVFCFTTSVLIGVPLLVALREKRMQAE